MQRLPPPPLLGRAAAKALNAPLARSQASSAAAARRAAPELTLFGSGDDCFRAAQQAQGAVLDDARTAQQKLVQLMRQPSVGLSASLVATEVSRRPRGPRRHCAW